MFCLNRFLLLGHSLLGFADRFKLVGKEVIVGAAAKLVLHGGDAFGGSRVNMERGW